MAYVAIGGVRAVIGGADGLWVVIGGGHLVVTPTPGVTLDPSPRTLDGREPVNTLAPFSTRPFVNTHTPKETTNTLDSRP